MYKPLSSSGIELITVSQKVRHKILYALARSVAMEQLAKRKTRQDAEQKKKAVKKTVIGS
ncbi:hypothetical protein [Sediminibacterium sp.]|uniref:hypothetical protein n=1 Tax=Sediminibacterium sp. TaxID=1917865 RepID=UPI0025F7C538|nr:hypothetical protein [Sediminibacterium sp.]MBW0176913.1 hypothetical protein [Sediminibacterium sp.]